MFPNKEGFLENDKKLMTFCISDFEETENFSYFPFSSPIFFEVLNNILKAKNKEGCERCRKSKQASKLFLTKKDTSDIVNPTTKDLKKVTVLVDQNILEHFQVMQIIMMNLYSF